MSDTSMDKIYKAIGMCRAHGLHGTEVLLLDLAARIEALEARVAAADKLADQAQMVKDFRYDPNIGVQLNFLEEAIAAYEDTKDQSK